MMSLNKKNLLSDFLGAMIVFIGLVSIGFFGFYFYSLDRQNKQSFSENKQSFSSNNVSNQSKQAEAEILTPGKLISEGVKNNNQTMTVRGVIDQETVVCEKRECSVNDSCCGCPQNKNLVLVEPQISLENKLQTQLTLLGQNLEPLCQRQADSCQYSCVGWVRGGVYEVTGIFHAETQPGLKVLTGLNLQVQNKTMVKNLNFFDSLTGFFEGLKQALGQFKTQGSFVNH